jgi:prolyl-tRNA synthetase
LDVNETKLTNLLGSDIHPAVITEDCGLKAGYIGPYQIQGNYTILFDRSLHNSKNLSCGANVEEYHYVGFQIERDYGKVEYHDLSKVKEGGICPHCGKQALSIVRGIEVGNIFQLGTKYTKAMNMQYIDKDGNYQYPIMGCYGIGVGRLAASVCEVHHDEYGPIWPITIAPWQVHLCCLRSDDIPTKEFADHLYEELLLKRVEVIYDDRNVRAGVMFSDADLLGVPIRVILSPKNLQEDQVEIISRDKKIAMRVKKEDVVHTIQKLIHEFIKEKESEVITNAQN